MPTPILNGFCYSGSINGSTFLGRTFKVYGADAVILLSPLSLWGMLQETSSRFTLQGPIKMGCFCIGACLVQRFLIILTIMATLKAMFVMPGA
jgi:hypothetical protein